MKKILSLILCSILVLSFTACKSKDKQDTTSSGAVSLVEEIITDVSDKEKTSSDTESENNTSTTSSKGDKNCNHDYEKATCEKPSTCKKCGATKGKALGHTYNSNSSTAKCVRCKLSRGSSHTHDFTEPTCDKPSTCTQCGETTGSALGHLFYTKNCEIAVTCVNCNKAVGTPTGHDWRDASCTAKARCKNCGKTKGEELGHNFSGGKCTRCSDTSDRQLTALYLGDSVCQGVADVAGGNAWCGRIEAQYGIKGTNIGKSGWYISEIGNATIISEYAGVNPSDYDYIILQGGINDVSNGLSQWGEISPVGTSTFDNTTICGALEELIQYTLKTAPDAKIGFIINFQIIALNKTNWTKFCGLAEEICKKWDIEYIYLDKVEGFTDEFVLETYLPDRVHPNAAGYEILGRYLGEWMKSFAPNKK